MLTNCLKSYPASVFITLCVIVLSLIPFPDVELAHDVPLADKWTHMVMYATIALVVCWERRRALGRLAGQVARADVTGFLLWALVFPAVLGGVLELLQEYCTTTRGGEWLDFLADGIGAALGCAVGTAWAHQRLSRQRRKG